MPLWPASPPCSKVCLIKRDFPCRSISLSSSSGTTSALHAAMAAMPVTTASSRKFALHRGQLLSAIRDVERDARECDKPSSRKHQDCSSDAQGMTLSRMETQHDIKRIVHHRKKLKWQGMGLRT